VSTDLAATAPATPRGTDVSPTVDDEQLDVLARLAALVARAPRSSVVLVAHGRVGEPDAADLLRYPLRGDDGTVLGTLGLADVDPADLDADQRTGLADVAATAAALLAHRSDVRARERSTEQAELERDEAAAADALLIARQSAVVEAQCRVAEADLVPADVAERISETAQDLTSGTGAAVVEVDGDRLVVTGATGTLTALLSAELSLAGSLTGRAVRWQTTVRCGAGDLDPTDVAETLAGAAGAMLAVPLHRDDVVVGAVLVAAAGPEELGPEDAEALEVLAGSFAAAVVNARVMEAAADEAAIDALTGLPSRSAAVFVLGQALARQDRFGGHMAVLQLDLQGLDLVHDVHGPAAGDEVLRQVAQRLSATVRRVDTAARSGGDQFLVVFENIAQLEDGDLLAGRLARAVEGEYVVEGGVRVTVGVSVGMALAPDVVTGTTQPMTERTAALLDAAHDSLSARPSAVAVPV
jgi:diguanylate cyclase (GGDEF)-like protein